MDKEKILKSISFALAISGIVLFIDILLTQFFSIGTEQKQFLLGYYCAMVFSNIVYPELKKNKFVIYPLYLIICLKIFLLVKNYFF